MSRTSNNSYLNKAESLSNTRETRITTNELKVISIPIDINTFDQNKETNHNQNSEKKSYRLYFLKHQKHLSFILHENELIGESNYQNRLKI